MAPATTTLRSFPTSNKIDTTSQARSQASSVRRTVNTTTQVILGVCITVGVLTLIFCVVVSVLFYRRRRTRERRVREETEKLRGLYGSGSGGGGGAGGGGGGGGGGGAGVGAGAGGNSWNVLGAGGAPVKELSQFGEGDQAHSMYTSAPPPVEIQQTGGLREGMIGAGVESRGDHIGELGGSEVGVGGVKGEKGEKTGEGDGKKKLDPVELPS